MIDKRMSVAEAVRKFAASGQTVMVGGFGRGGVPFSVLEFMADHQDDYRDLTLVKNDASEPGLGIAPLLANGQAKCLIATHIGLNPEFIAQMNRGEVACEFVPQGIFAERIRAGGAGIPAFLTDIGFDTTVAEGKPTVELDGREWLLERALRGNLALICADRADTRGNAWWRGSNRNMCIVMGTACDAVILEAKEIVDEGDLAPEEIHLPGVYVNAVVPAAPRRHIQQEDES